MEKRQNLVLAKYPKFSNIDFNTSTSKYKSSEDLIEVYTVRVEEKKVT